MFGLFGGHHQGPFEANYRVYPVSFIDKARRACCSRLTAVAAHRRAQRGSRRVLPQARAPAAAGLALFSLPLV